MLALCGFIGVVVAIGFLEQRVLVPFADSQDPAKEVVYWEEHVERNEATAESRLRLGLARAKAGQLDAAEESFRTALKLMPDYHAAAIGLYGVAVRKDDQDRPLAELDRYARENPDCVVCWQNLAAAYLELRRLREAETAVVALLASDFSVDSKMYSVDNMAVEAAVLAGRVYAARGDTARAIGFFRDAIIEEPGDLRAYILQAKNLLADRQPEAALAVLEAAAPRTAGNPRMQKEIERLTRRAHQVKP
jgi:predicted Zn-dependent protease